MAIKEVGQYNSVKYLNKMYNYELDENINFSWAKFNHADQLFQKGYYRTVSPENMYILRHPRVYDHHPLTNKSLLCQLFDIRTFVIFNEFSCI